MNEYNNCPTCNNRIKLKKSWINKSNLNKIQDQE